MHLISKMSAGRVNEHDEYLPPETLIIFKYIYTKNNYSRTFIPEVFIG